jgi:hypothetical protein
MREQHLTTVRGHDEALLVLWKIRVVGVFDVTQDL